MTNEMNLVIMLLDSGVDFEKKIKNGKTYITTSNDIEFIFENDKLVMLNNDKKLY